LKIKIETPCRLHFGLIDLNGQLGRINGGLGVALEQPGWEIKGWITEKIDPELSQSPSLISVINKFDNYFKTKTSDFKLKITKKIPQHIGLGSNTQFCLAIGAILAKIHNIETSVVEIANAVKRGGTSGIGVATFEKGGIILDGGHTFGPGKQTESFKPSSVSTAPPPPIIFSHNPPKNWHFVLLTPRTEQGSFGKKEIDLFSDNCPIPEKEVEKLSRLILVKILPAIIEEDIQAFGEGLTEMQNNFTRFGMHRYKKGIVYDLLDYARNNQGIFGSGISSFGPTVFALTDDEKKAEKIIKEVNDTFPKNEFDLILSSKVNTTGAKIEKMK
jgi:beta-ribofuranosylaminobenzene 5'-phosphate synthase